MLKSLFKTLSNFLSSLFGQRPEPRPLPKPPVDRDDLEVETTIQDAPEVPEDDVEELDETNVLNDDFVPATLPHLPTKPIVPATRPTLPKAKNTPTDEPPLSEKTDASTPEEKQKDKLENQPQSRYLWCLDNGHGKLQAGKRSPVFRYKGKDVQFFEYEFNRDIVERIMKALD
ncbi:MAG: hypothetical protein D6714_12550, partial [Bacteroidetes bacterium]